MYKDTFIYILLAASWIFWIKYYIKVSVEEASSSKK